MTKTFHTTCNTVLEWGYTSGKAYADPFNQVELDLAFSGPDGQELRLPAYWSGGQEWRVRFSAPQPGRYTFRTTCSDPDNESMHAQHGEVEADPYTGDNPLFRHGGLRPSADRRYLEHLDGTPFFWLGDTWWMALTDRLKWPEEFKIWVEDRATKGFTVVHMVAGLFPDMPAFDPRGKNEGGYAWETDFERVNPAFFDQADLKVQWAVGCGLTPLIVGAWGYYLPWLGLERMKKHWRYLAARWSAYPVLWCLAGEVSMPWYLSERKEAEPEEQRAGWTEVGKYLREIDAYRRPVTAHTAAMMDSAKELIDPAPLDFNFIQTGHGNLTVAIGAAKRTHDVITSTSLFPVIQGEVCYEGILGSALQDVQRFLFWSSILQGAGGYSYGANGLWQINRPGKPYGPSPHGMAWGGYAWPEALQLPGAAQIALGKKLLERYRWWLFEPHQEWVTPHAGGEDYFQPYAAGIAGEVRMVYFPWPVAPWVKPFPRILGLEKGVIYNAFYFNPLTGQEYPAGQAQDDQDGAWRVPMPESGVDIVLVLERAV